MVGGPFLIALGVFILAFVREVFGWGERPIAPARFSGDVFKS